jgi:hypothetical protein
VRRVAIACILLFSLVACKGDAKHSSTATTFAPLPSTTVPFGSPTVSTPDNTEQDVVTRVQVGKHDEFTRVVFEFADLVPGFAVKAAQPPFVQDGSGATVNVTGAGHLAVRLVARAHDEDGKPSYAGGTRTSGVGEVTEVVRTGDFEGVVNFVIGTKRTPSFRVLTQANPPRLIIDIASA